MKNKILKVVCILYAVFLFTSCNDANSKRENSSSNEQNTIFQSTVAPYNTIIKLKELNITQDMPEVALYNEKLLYASFPKENEKNSGIYQYDINTGKETLCKQLDYAYTTCYGSSVINSKGNWYYYSAINRADGNNSLVVLDSYNIKNNEFATISKIKTETPFCDIYAFNNDTLAVWTPAITPDGKLNTYSLDYLNVSNQIESNKNVLKTILNRENEEGTQITAISIYQDIIYAFCQEEGKSYFILYDNKGKQIEKRNVIFVKDTMKHAEDNKQIDKNNLFPNSAIWNFQTFKNYFWFQDTSNNYAIAKYEENKMKVLYQQTGSAMQISPYTKDTANNKYIYFANEKNIWVFDKKSERMTSIKIDPGYNYMRIYFVTTDEDDNTVVGIDDEQCNTKYYYVSSNQIKERLK